MNGAEWRAQKLTYTHMVTLYGLSIDSSRGSIHLGVYFCAESACNAGDPALLPGSGRFPGEGNGNPLQYSCLENSMNREASVQFSPSVMSDSFQLYGLHPARLLCSWNSPGKNTGEGSHSILQGIFPTQGSNLGFPHCRQVLYH